MFLIRNPRNARHIHAILAVAAVFGLLVARNVPPEFREGQSLRHSSIRCASTLSTASNHDQRPRFDFNGLGWSVPVEEFLPFPPTSFSAHLTSISQLFPALHTKGFHYNRPPPLS
jgi:hypothetical protein